MWFVSLAFAAAPKPPPDGPSSMLPVPLPAPKPPPPPAPPSPDQPVWDAVNLVYGKEVPHSSVCIAHLADDGRPLPNPFHGAPVAVGTKRGPLGCVLLGVMVDGTWLEPGSALPAALEPAAFAAMDAVTREKVLLQWTDGLLLAFQQPHGLGLVHTDPKTKLTTVDRQYYRRDDGPGRSVDAVTKWTYGPDLVTTASVEQVQAKIATALFVRPNKVEGLADGVVDKALESKGLVIRQCFTDAWNRDLALDGRVVLEWLVHAGAVGEVAVVTEDGTDETLAKCYANAVRGGTYPADATGSVSWVFGIDKDIVKQ